MTATRFGTLFCFALASRLFAQPAIPPIFAVTTDHPDGVYAAGDTVKWQVDWSGKDAPPAATFAVKLGDWKTNKEGSLAFEGGRSQLTTPMTGPGTVILEVHWKPEGGGRDRRALAGAVAAPEKIPLSAERPADFDTFWQSKFKELAAIPPHPQLTAGESGRPQVSYWKITMDNIRGSKIQGQIARPKNGNRLPALLIVQWAGVYPLQKDWVIHRAEQGWLALNIEAHDLPIDEPAAFYREQSSGPLKNYAAIGNDDREASYFLRMYLSCYRAAEYLTTRSDWDGKTLVVMGDSQGGLQTLVTAAIHPKVSAALALVPAGCDMLGPDVGRKPGWPGWIENAQNKDLAKVRQAARYYDIANFTSRIKCPVLVGLGLVDETCPPAGVFAAMNQVTAPKEIIILTHSGHQDVNGSQLPHRKRREEAWLPALREGRTPPVNQ